MSRSLSGRSEEDDFADEDIPCNIGEDYSKGEYLYNKKEVGKFDPLSTL